MLRSGLDVREDHVDLSVYKLVGIERALCEQQFPDHPEHHRRDE